MTGSEYRVYLGPVTPGLLGTVSGVPGSSHVVLKKGICVFVRGLQGDETSPVL